MNETELAQCYAVLGLAPGCSVEELERAFMKKNFALIKGNTGDEPKRDVEAERQQLRAAHEALAAHLKAEPEKTKAAKPRIAPRLTPTGSPPPPPKGLITPPKLVARRHEPQELAIFRFDSWPVNLLVPPLLLGGMWVATKTFFAPLMQGAFICAHEVGHAVPAWFAGWRATPLPWGWTPVEQERSNFVYFGLLFLLALFFAAGVKERKVWPVILAPLLAALQFYMTWRMPEHRKEFWMVAGGVGGEFVLGTLLMMAFWMHLPDKFRWGIYRHLFFLIGAAAFLGIWLRWQDIYVGKEEIPFGSMINGEDDANGDMNRLMADYGWKKFDIRRRYHLLGRWCWVALGAIWAFHALRLNEALGWIMRKVRRGEEPAE